jgi:preprotein translocase subunit SecF
LEKKNNEAEYINDLKKNLEKKLNDSIDFRRVEIVGTKSKRMNLQNQVYMLLLISLVLILYIYGLDLNGSLV